MPNINYGDIASQPPQKFIEVDAPEFGPGMTVMVRPPTANDRVLIGNIIKTGKVVIGDVVTYKYNPPLVFAALCSVDERGDLVFGLTPMDAVNTCLAMDGRFANLFSRIALAVAEVMVPTKQEAADHGND